MPRYIVNKFFSSSKEKRSKKFGTGKMWSLSRGGQLRVVTLKGSTVYSVSVSVSL